jgi:large subunit ribosomal protein L10
MTKTREQKNQIIKDLAEKLDQYDFFYLAEPSGLSVAEVNELRSQCKEQEVTYQVTKNTLLKKAMEEHDDKFEDLYDHLSGPTAVFFTETSNAPAKILKKFRKEHDKPLLKAAYLEEAIYEGDEKLKELAKLKSKEELIGDILMLLKSPMQRVVGGLQSGGQRLAGLLDALAE